MNIFVSTVSDGPMKLPNADYSELLPNIERFFNSHAINAADTTLVQVTYNTDNFCRYIALTDSAKGDGIIKPSSIIADALVVTKPHHALFLPLADCIGAVIYDAAKNILTVSHLGRHSLEQHGGIKSINYLRKKFDCNPKDISIWLSPAAGKNNYPLYSFDNRSLHEVAAEQLKAAGVKENNIDMSPIDSALDQKYYSHSQFLKGNQDIDGRFAVVAVMS